MRFSLFHRSTSVPGRMARAAGRALRRRLGSAQGLGSALATVTGYWDRQASDAFAHDLERLSWTGIPQVHANHNYLITGSRDIYWVSWLRDRYFADGNAGDVLSLGCGAGHLDRILKRCGFAMRSLTGIDVSRRSVARAQELAAEVDLAPSVSYVAGDLNRSTLPEASFDFIYFFQSLHHIQALEHVLTECQRALRPNGILLVNEFVGPSRFQWSRQQVDAANAELALLPDELRVDLATGSTRSRVVCPTVEDMLAVDPSEAVRSAEIERELKNRFDVFEEWNWGGTLNHLVFQNIAGNFAPKNPEHQRIVERLIDHENSLIRDRVLPSDFKVFLARHPRSRAND